MVASSVADFGCGQCDYIININRAGFDSAGFDGHPKTLNNTKFAKIIDLSQPINLGRQYDYVQCFEVGEHIPITMESVFIDNISKHARRGLILSWAIRGQWGYLHVNNQDNSYVIE
jgi:2-polyprenyl-3-methyl-5-hydroxy-6-metoxy-1,4-benzoquinol methylase